MSELSQITMPEQKEPSPTRDAGVLLVLERIAASHLAKRIGITPQAINLWKRVPNEQVEEVSRITRIPPYVLRPDSYEMFLRWQRVTEEFND